jgi:hypothetical protein
MSQKPFWLLLYSKRLAKNPLFEVISLRGPMGPHEFYSNSQVDKAEDSILD